MAIFISPPTLPRWGNKESEDYARSQYSIVMTNCVAIF